VTPQSNKKSCVRLHEIPDWLNLYSKVKGTITMVGDSCAAQIMSPRAAGIDT